MTWPNKIDTKNNALNLVFCDALSNLHGQGVNGEKFAHIKITNWLSSSIFKWFSSIWNLFTYGKISYKSLVSYIWLCYFFSHTHARTHAHTEIPIKSSPKTTRCQKIVSGVVDSMYSTVKDSGAQAVVLSQSRVWMPKCSVADWLPLPRSPMGGLALRGGGFTPLHPLAVRMTRTFLCFFSSRNSDQKCGKRMPVTATIWHGVGDMWLSWGLPFKVYTGGSRLIRTRTNQNHCQFEVFLLSSIVCLLCVNLHA